METPLARPPDTSDLAGTVDEPEHALLLSSRVEMPSPAPIGLSVDDFDNSIAEVGLHLDGVPVLPTLGVEGESPPILDNRAPDRGVTFP